MSDRNKILRQQQELSNKINSLLEQSAQTLLCGPACQREQNLSTLKQKYLNAQTNLQTAPIQLEETKKKYIILKDGEAAYNQLKMEELKKKAKELISEIENKFKLQASNAKLMNTYLDTELINTQNTKELLMEYNVKDELLVKKFADKKSETITNDRKSYYENQELDRLNSWSTFLYILYYFFLLILCTEIIFYEKIKLPFKIVLIFIFFFYPFIISRIMSSLFGI